MISTVIAAESQLFRELLFDAMNRRGDLSVVATAPDHRRALALVEDLHADVVVISMGLADAPQLITALVQKGVRIVTLGPCEEPSVAVVPDGMLNDVIAAVHGAMHGAFAVDTTLPVQAQLTPTERRVLQSINDGLSNKEIAQALGVAVPTVKHHVHSLLAKLGVRRRGEAAALYRRTGNARGYRDRPPPISSLRSRSLPQG